MMESGHYHVTPGGVGKRAYHQAAIQDPQTASYSTSIPSANHRRGLSGSLFSRLPFLRPSTEAQDEAPKTGQSNEPRDGTEGYRQLAFVQRKTRSRKGSLRKTALLGTSKAKFERKNSGMSAIVTTNLDRSVLNNDDRALVASPDTDDYPTPRASYDRSASAESSGSRSKGSNVFGLGVSSGSDERLPLHGFERKATTGDMSTTDEDEGLSFPPTGPGVVAGVSLKKAGGESYFPVDTVLRRRSLKAKSSPLAGLPLEPATAPEEWDYSETEWWGWIILVATWVLFVMGMGSCFGVWSWAWDVGETPYAPPELEDDPTLPIVGYYPALIILTGVMAWVWVVIAWVGMKYFKHANLSGEDR